MNSALLNAIALVLTAPWWLPLAKHLVAAMDRASSPASNVPPRDDDDLRDAGDNEWVYARAARAWGAEAPGRRPPARLVNAYWSTGRRRAPASPAAFDKRRR